MSASFQGQNSTLPRQPRSRRQRRANIILQSSILMNVMYDRVNNWPESPCRGPVCLRFQPAIHQPGAAARSSATTSLNSNIPSSASTLAARPSLAPLRHDSRSAVRSSEITRTVKAAAVPAGSDESLPPPPSAAAETAPAAPATSVEDSEAARRGLASMAQLAAAWAQVSSRLTPEILMGLTDGGMAANTAAAAVSYGPGEAPGSGTMDGVDGGEGGGGGGGGVGWNCRAGAPLPSISRMDEGKKCSDATGARASARARSSSGLPLPPPPPPPPPSMPQEAATQRNGPIQETPLMERSQQQQWAQQQQQQRPHFEAIITALKLALATLQHAPPRRDGRPPATRAVQLASTLAELCAAGLPLDAAAMCAGVVSEAADLGALRADVIRAQLGPDVAALVHDMLRVRQAPRRIELLDDEGASAVREWCLAFHDVRACVVEVVSWWDELQHMSGMPLFEQQALALEALQIGAPLGHALGLGALSAVMEDKCLTVLFPGSYASTSTWLRGLMDPAEDLLFAAQQRLLASLDRHPDFSRLAGGLVVKARTKSLFSVMKKLLQLGDMARGGRSREELYDLLGMRAVVKPAEFLPPEEAEAAATKACYVVQDVACKLWRPVPSRSKDYIVAPKPNGYQSIHLTLQLGQVDMSYQTYGNSSAAAATATAAVSGDATPVEPLWPTELRSQAVSLPSPPSPSPPPPPSFASAPASYLADEHRSAPPSTTSSSSSTSSHDWDQLPYMSTAGALPGLDSPVAGSLVASPPSPATQADADAAAAAAAAAGGPLCMELQIRTAAMDSAAESGDAAHAVYKGGLDARTARQLQTWTQELQRRLSEQPRGRLLLRAATATAAAAAMATSSPEAAAEERRRRRRERRAAAAAAALTAAAPLPLPPPATAAALRPAESLLAESQEGAHSNVEVGTDAGTAALPLGPLFPELRISELLEEDTSPLLLSPPSMQNPIAAAAAVTSRQMHKQSAAADSPPTGGGAGDVAGDNSRDGPPAGVSVRTAKTGAATCIDTSSSPCSSSSSSPFSAATVAAAAAATVGTGPAAVAQSPGSVSTCSGGDGGDGDGGGGGGGSEPPRSGGDATMAQAERWVISLTEPSRQSGWDARTAGNGSSGGSSSSSSSSSIVAASSAAAPGLSPGVCDVSGAEAEAEAERQVTRRSVHKPQHFQEPATSTTAAPITMAQQQRRQQQEQEHQLEQQQRLHLAAAGTTAAAAANDGDESDKAQQTMARAHLELPSHSFGQESLEEDGEEEANGPHLQQKQPAAGQELTMMTEQQQQRAVKVQQRPEQHDQHLKQQAEQAQEQEQQLTAKQRLLLFSSLDEAEEAPLVIGLGQRDAAAAAEQLFRHLDVNGDGRLSLAEMCQALTDLAAPANERDAAALLAALDRNGDGAVSMEEFLEGLSRETEQQLQEQQQRPPPAPPSPPPPPVWQPWHHRT